MKYYKRDDCRLCGKKNMTQVLELTPTPPADSYVPETLLGIDQETIPLDLYLCADCGHVQLGYVIDAEEVYLNYLYETASTLGLDGHFKECAATIMNKFIPNIGGLVIDIGSNDGCLLSYFQDYDMQVLGIDPMPGIAQKASQNGIPTLDKFFTEEFATELRENHGAAAIITSNNLVADTDDLDSFVRGVRKLMDDESIFFFETFYLFLQIKNHVWDFTYHEHYSYFTIKPLINYFEGMGMELIDVEPNLTKGGSMRCTLQLAGAGRTIGDSVGQYISKETAMGFHTNNAEQVFVTYKNKIEAGKDEFLSLMSDLRQAGKRIAGYGASATSTTLMYHYEMAGTLEYLVDDFEEKHNLFSPGMHIPVMPSQYIYEQRPDYIVILAWRYYEKIIERNRDYLAHGGKFIVPLPELRVIDS